MVTASTPQVGMSLQSRPSRPFEVANNSVCVNVACWVQSRKALYNNQSIYQNHFIVTALVIACRTDAITTSSRALTLVLWATADSLQSSLEETHACRKQLLLSARWHPVTWESLSSGTFRYRAPVWMNSNWLCWEHQVTKLSNTLVMGGARHRSKCVSFYGKPSLVSYSCIGHITRVI